MDKRTFLKNSALLSIGGSIVATLPGSLRAADLLARGSNEDEIFKLPELDYAYDALEPNIDAMTMEVHHTKHHA